MITDNTKERILASVNIVDIIDLVVPLKKLGKTHKACCPFHKEKTPSFGVVEDKQYFNCFGCGAAGDVIKFVMMYHDLSFQNALEMLAKYSGIDVERDNAVVVPRKAMEDYQMDRMIIKMADMDGDKQMTYTDKQRLRLAQARIEGFSRKYGE